MRMRTTWSGRSIRGKSRPIFNQIDYIFLPSNMKCLLQNAQSYYGHIHSSDHGLVRARLNFQRFVCVTKRRLKLQKQHWNLSDLTQDPLKQQDYQHKLLPLISNSCESLDQFSTSPIKAANQVLGNHKNTAQDKNQK